MWYLWLHVKLTDQCLEKGVTRAPERLRSSTLFAWQRNNLHPGGGGELGRGTWNRPHIYRNFKIHCHRNDEREWCQEIAKVKIEKSDSVVDLEPCELTGNFATRLSNFGTL